MSEPGCTYSCTYHQNRPALYRRGGKRWDAMYYCQECRDALPPCPSNLLHPPERIGEQFALEFDKEEAS